MYLYRKLKELLKKPNRLISQVILKNTNFNCFSIYKKNHHHNKKQFYLQEHQKEHSQGQLTKAQELDVSIKLGLGACNPSTWELQAGAQSHP